MKLAPAGLALALCVTELAAQEPGNPAPESTATRPILPQIPARDLRWMHQTWSGFTLNLGFAVLADYTAFSQDSTSEAQVGAQQDQWDLRAARALARGTIGSGEVRYLLIVEYGGLDREPEEHRFGVLDLQLAVPLAGGQLAMGKIKEPWIYEMAGDAINLQTTERMLNPFFVSRNIGLRWYRRVTPWLAASAGLFNDGWTHGLSLSESGTQLVTRIAFLPVNDVARNRFVHFAVAGRYNGADNDSLRLKGRPESDVSSAFVDTGNLPASHENELSLELMAVAGRLTVSAEHVNAFVHSPQTGNPALAGSYVAASWFLQPVRRPYDPSVSFARRPVPGNPAGALEFAGRWSLLDLDDAGAAGGTMTTWYGGVNWWVGTSWRVSAGYVHSRLDRFATRGTERAIHTRIQFLL